MEKITTWCKSKITDPDLQPGSSNETNDVNETIPISNITTIASSSVNETISTSNNTVIASTTLSGNDSIVDTISTSNNTVIASTTLSGNDSIVTDNTTTTTTTNTDIGAITNTTSGLAIDYDDEEGDFFGNNSKKPRLTIEDWSSVELELHRTNDNESIIKESKDTKKRPKNQPNKQSKRTKVSDKSKLDQSDFNDIVTADDIGQEPSASKTIKAKSKKPNQSVAGLSSKARSIGVIKSKSNQKLNANDVLSDLCGNSVTGDTNVTMGGHCTNENTEGEDGGRLLYLHLVGLFWKRKKKKLKKNRTN